MADRKPPWEHTQRGGPPGRSSKPPLRVFATTLWEYPSQHYDERTAQGPADPAPSPLGTPSLTTPASATPPRSPTEQGDKDYIGATPSWVIWQCLQRYTREGDSVLDPMCGSGTTLDVCNHLRRKGIGFDLAPSRPDILAADARKLPTADASIDFCFVDPPYSTHVNYSDDPRCIGKLDAAGDDNGDAYYAAMRQVLAESARVLKDRRYMAVYASDSWRKRQGNSSIFMPIGFELFAMLRTWYKPVDIICVTRHNQKLAKGNWRKTAEEGNFFLRGFNYLLIMKKEADRQTLTRKRS